MNMFVLPVVHLISLCVILLRCQRVAFYSIDDRMTAEWSRGHYCGLFQVPCLHLPRAGVANVFDKEPQHLLSDDSRAARVKNTSVLKLAFRQPQNIFYWSCPYMLHAFGRTDHPQAIKYVILKLEIRWGHVLNLWDLTNCTGHNNFYVAVNM
jgi:hypothetical protein